MQIDLHNLPSDTDTLHRLVRNLTSVMTRRDEEIERLQAIIRKLQRAQFGRRAERFDPDQLDLALEDLEQDIARTEVAHDIPVLPTPEAKVKDLSRALPDHLPRTDIVFELEHAA